VLFKAETKLVVSIQRPFHFIKMPPWFKIKIKTTGMAKNAMPDWAYRLMDRTITF
jgi:hypothetical protein